MRQSKKSSEGWEPLAGACVFVGYRTGTLRNCVEDWGGGREEMNERKVGPQAPMQTGVNQGKNAAKLGRDVQSKIGQQLRAIYDGVVSQGVPDRFAELLDRLDKRDDRE